MTGNGFKKGAAAGAFAVVDLLFRWGVGAIFVYAGVQKIIDPAGFARTIFGYGILPGELVNLVAIVLPWVEVLAGGALLAGVWPVSASWVISGLLLLFMAAIVFNIARGYTFDCGCFGSGSDPAGWATVWRDGAMLVPAVGVMLFRGRRHLCLYAGGE